MMKSKQARALLFLFVPLTFVIIILAYFIGVVSHSNKFMPNTTINGINCSSTSTNEAEKLLTKSYSNYELKLKFSSDDTEVISGEQIDYNAVIDNGIQSILNRQNRLLWPIYYFGAGENLEATISVDYNKDKLLDIINTFDSISNPGEKSINAQISTSLNDEGLFYIIPEQIGTEIDSEKLTELIIDAIENGITDIDLSNANIYKQPEITSNNSELIAELDNKNNSIDFTVTYHIHGDTLEYNSEYFANYVYKDSNTGSYELSDEVVDDIMSDLNSRYTTMGITRDFTTHDGREIKVRGGNWGWWLDKEASGEILADALANKTDTTLEVVWYQECPGYGDSEYTNYVEIDMGQQHLYLYTDEKLVGNWDIVTGLASDPGRKTPEGTYILSYKTRNTTLKGPTWSSFVSYWMPFNGGIGMHDASWQPSFGGNIYAYRGSHGCINMPTNGAKTVYEVIDKTYAIICYY